MPEFDFHNHFQRQGKLFHWVQKIPKEDRQWARSYLLQKRVQITSDTFEADSNNNNFPDTAEFREIELKLRNAWRQRKNRKKVSGRKILQLRSIQRIKAKAK